MKKFISIYLLLFLIKISLLAQVKGTGVSVMAMPYIENNAIMHKPMPYQYVREADVMWSKIIWRKIDLNEKMNHILALPAEPARGSMNLFDAIMYAIKNSSLTVYKASADDAGHEFDNPMDLSEVDKARISKTEPVLVQKDGGPEVGLITDTVYSKRYYDVKAFMVKEVWFFDKQRSVMDVRIIGLCPIGVDTLNGQTRMKKLFWVNYAQARPFLAKMPVYFPYTDNKEVTFDDIFQKRFFSSYIFMESNPYRRAIVDYEKGLEALLESDRIKNEIIDFEQDLWEY